MPTSALQPLSEESQRASSMADTACENQAAVRNAFEAWVGARGSVFDLLADDATWTIPGSTFGAGQWRGRQSYIDAAVTPLFEKLAAPTQPELIALWAVGDKVIVRWRQNTPLKTGGTYRNEYAWFLTMQQGRVTAVTAFLDLAAYAAVVEGNA